MVTQPPALAAVPAERVVEVDVRDDLRSGREPFGRIMAARRDLPAGGAIRLRAIFEPVPLYAAMAKHGLDHWTERLAADDWVVWFYPAGGGTDQRDAGPREEPRSTASGEDDEVIVLDVRGMEPPEPLVRTLAALDSLPRGKTLVQLNERVPELLLPRLSELGFTYRLKRQGEALVRVFIDHLPER